MVQGPNHGVYHWRYLPKRISPHLNSVKFNFIYLHITQIAVLKVMQGATSSQAIQNTVGEVSEKLHMSQERWINKTGAHFSIVRRYY